MWKWDLRGFSTISPVALGCFSPRGVKLPQNKYDIYYQFRWLMVAHSSATRRSCAVVPWARLPWLLAWSQAHNLWRAIVGSQSYVTRCYIKHVAREQLPVQLLLYCCTVVDLCPRSTWQYLWFSHLEYKVFPSDQVSFSMYLYRTCTNIICAGPHKDTYL